MSVKNSEDEINRLNFKVGLLEKDVETLTIYSNRLDKVIEVLKDLTEGISKMIAIHEEKHIQIEKEEKRLNLEIVDTNKRFERAIDKIREELKLTREEITKKVNQISTDKTKEDDQLKTRVSNIEKRMWMAVGVMATIMFLLNFASKFLL